MAYTPVWLILQCGLYSSVAYTPVWLILQCGLYSSAAYTPENMALVYTVDFTYNELAYSEFRDVANSCPCPCLNPYKIDPSSRTVFVKNESNMVGSHVNQVHSYCHEPLASHDLLLVWCECTSVITTFGYKELIHNGVCYIRRRL